MSGPNDSQPLRVLIGLGSNLDPENNIRKALEMLSNLTDLLETSSIWQTPAVGSTGPDYLNAAALIETDLALSDLKEKVLLEIETRLGRVRTADKYSDRTIDLDVLIYDGAEIDPDLWTLAHVAVPASQIFPEFINPATGESLESAGQRLSQITPLAPWQGPD